MASTSVAASRGNGDATRPSQYLIVFSLFLLCFKGCCGKVGCIERKREAFGFQNRWSVVGSFSLLQFKIGGVDDFGMLSSLGNGEDERNCCINWRGVECDDNTGHVISLDLHGKPLAETGDPRFLGGKICPSLSELKHLTHLNLSWNHFQGN